MSQQLAKLREADAAIQATVLELEIELAKKVASLETSNVASKISKAPVAKARGQLLAIRTPRVFQYLAALSTPPLGSSGKDACAYYGLEFIWKAAVLSSCGCFLHPLYVAELIASQTYRSKCCKDVLVASSNFHLADL